MWKKPEISIIVALSSIASLILLPSLRIVSAEDPKPTSMWIDAIHKVGSHGVGNREAAAAWKQLSQLEAEHLPEILAGMDKADRIQMNWLRAAVDAMVQRSIRDRKEIPMSQILSFLKDRKHAPKARRTAFEVLVRVNPHLRSELIPLFMNDTSVELRRDAVAEATAKASQLEKNGDKAGALSAFRTVLSAARDVDQIKAASTKLKEFGESVDLPSHFGFILNWQVIGPFDNSNMNGFDTPHPPETESKLEGKYVGKNGEIGWTQYVSTDEFGVIDLTKALDKHKGASAYALHNFESAQDRPIEIRLGSANANKIWLNGELLTANEVYHLGQEIDQYLATGRLKKGPNTILVKICQNEQTEDWAQRWQFQLRVCDEVGTAVLAENRPKIEAKPAAAFRLPSSHSNAFASVIGP